jgi:hypothetical protein
MSAAAGSIPGVIPAKAAIHFDLAFKAKWIPAFAGMTTVGAKGDRA